MPQVNGKAFEPAATYSVALPRNLLKGAFDIQPLIDFGKTLEIQSEDAFLPALNCVIMQQAQRIWRSLGSDFDALDLDGNGELTREEITLALRLKYGEDPSAIMVDNVISSIDEDRSGTISRDEFERISRPERIERLRPPM